MRKIKNENHIFAVLIFPHMKKFLAALAVMMCVNNAFAQLGVSVAPYFWSSSFRSDMYSRTNGFGNIPLGVCTNINYNNKWFAEFSTFRMMGEKELQATDNYGYGVPGGFTHKPFRWTELHIDYSLFGRKWEDMEKWAPAFALRAGVIFNTRMTMLAPQVGMDSVWTPNPPNYWVDSIVPLNRFDLTGLKQTLLTAGFSIKLMRKKEVRVSGQSGEYFRDLTTGEVFFVPGDQYYSNEYARVRQWDFYADFIYAASETYDGYLGWDHRQAGTRSISGDAIPGKERFGWRWGIRHMAYNPFGLQWVIEYMQLPGQKPFPAVEDLDEPLRKNRYFLIGLNITIGFNVDVH